MPRNAENNLPQSYLDIVSHNATIGGESLLSPSNKGMILNIARNLDMQAPEKILPNKARIALIIPYNPHDEVGGLEIGTLNLAHHLRQLGQNVEIITVGEYPEKDLRGEILWSDGTPIIGVGSNIKDISSYLLANHEKYDVVQWMEIFPPTPELPSQYNHQAEQQYLASVLLRSYGIKTFLYVATSGNVSKRGINNKNWDVAHQPLNVLLPRAMTGFNIINPDLENEYSAGGVKFDQSRMATIPLGVNVNHFSPIDKDHQMAMREKLNLPKDKTIFFYLGRFVKRKQPDQLLKIWNELPASVHDSAHLVFIGGAAGKGQPDSIYEEMMANLPLASDVSVIDLVTQEDMPSVIGACDIMVFPSEREGLGIVLLEAMACGKAVITTDIPGIRELLSSPNIGAMVDPHDYEAIGQQMQNFASNPKLCEELSLNARKHVVDKWGWPAITEKYLQFYRNCGTT